MVALDAGRQMKIEMSLVMRKGGALMLRSNGAEAFVIPKSAVVIRNQI